MRLVIYMMVFFFVLVSMQVIPLKGALKMAVNRVQGQRKKQRK